MGNHAVLLDLLARKPRKRGTPVVYSIQLRTVILNPAHVLSVSSRVSFAVKARECRSCSAPGQSGVFQVIWMRSSPSSASR
jgi:hypothetical protein